MRDVAFVAAILPLSISIGSELFTAVRAGKIVVGFSFYHIRMLFPPVITACIAAEQFLLSFRLLFDFRTAVLAIHILEFCVRESRQRFSFAAQTVAAAERLNRLQIQSHPLGYLAVAQSLHPQFPNHLFFVICHHNLQSLSLDSISAGGRWSVSRPATAS